MGRTAAAANSSGHLTGICHQLDVNLQEWSFGQEGVICQAGRARALRERKAHAKVMLLLAVDRSLALMRLACNPAKGSEVYQGNLNLISSYRSTAPGKQAFWRRTR